MSKMSLGLDLTSNQIQQIAGAELRGKRQGTCGNSLPGSDRKSDTYQLPLMIQQNLKSLSLSSLIHPCRWPTIKKQRNNLPRQITRI